MVENVMTDADFLAAFERCSLAQDQWTHRAHVRMAWLYLRQRPLSETVPVVREAIQRYNASLGIVSGYHETVTQAFLRLIGNRMQIDEGCESFEAFCARNPDLLHPSALLVHYRKETLATSAARQTFVEPDVRPLPMPPR